MHCSTQVESLTLEANRVQEANQHLQAQLRSSAEAEAAVKTLREEARQ